MPRYPFEARRCRCRDRGNALGRCGRHAQRRARLCGMIRFAVAFLLMTANALAAPLTPQSLHSTAFDYYEWQKREFPIDASDQGFHAYDDRLTDYSSEAVAKRAAHVHALLEKVRAATADGWRKDDKID